MTRMTKERRICDLERNELVAYFLFFVPFLWKGSQLQLYNDLERNLLDILQVLIDILSKTDDIYD